MALMMVLMVVLFAAVPGGHMGGAALHHSPDQASQSQQNDAETPVREKPSHSAEHDAMKSIQEKR